jgi:hypothetical protein
MRQEEIRLKQQLGIEDKRKKESESEFNKWAPKSAKKKQIEGTIGC